MPVANWRCRLFSMAKMPGSIILENGYYFLRALYEKLSDHPAFKLSTFSECLDEGVEIGNLPALVSGSWVYGTFSTWIGDRDKNRGWDMLGDAKRAFDKAISKGHMDSEQIVAAQLQLSICEGSDWFWWFGDYNPADSVSDFESLVPAALVQPL